MHPFSPKSARRLAVLVALLVLPWSFAAAASEEPSESAAVEETVVAQVGDRELTLGELMLRWASLPEAVRLGYGDRMTDFLRDTVSHLAISRAAEAANLDQRPLFEKLMEIRRDEVLRDLYARQTVFQDLGEESMRRRYDEQSARFEFEPRARLRHVLVTPVDDDPDHGGDGDAVGEAAARAKIERARQRIAAGDDFAEVARVLSEDRSAPYGGDLGWVSLEALAPRLAAIVRDLPVGEASAIVESELGLHVVEVLERRPGGTLPYGTVRELLFQEAVGERTPEFGRRAREMQDELLSADDVEIFPERLP